MESQQVKCLLSACNLLFLFTPCSAVIDLPLLHLYGSFKVIVSKKACPVIFTFDIYTPHKNLRTSTYVFPLFNTESLIFKIENIF